jgi:hypothetical protein
MRMNNSGRAASHSAIFRYAKGGKSQAFKKELSLPQIIWGHLSPLAYDFISNEELRDQPKVRRKRQRTAALQDLAESAGTWTGARASCSAAVLIPFPKLFTGEGTGRRKTLRPSW